MQIKNIPKFSRQDLGYMNPIYQAISAKKALRIEYKGVLRIVEVHAMGFNSAGNVAMSVWQVRGGSQSGEPSGWKTVLLSDITSIEVSDEASEAPRTGYNADNPGISQIILDLF